MGLRLLVAYDFSPAADAAASYASALARDAGGEVLLAHAVPVLAQGGQLIAGAPGVGDTAPSFDEVRALRARLAAKAAALGAHVRADVLLAPKVVQALVELATRERATMLVVGTRAHRGLSRVLLGSVADELLREAPCPVLALREEMSYAPHDGSV